MPKRTWTHRIAHSRAPAPSLLRFGWRSKERGSFSGGHSPGILLHVVSLSSHAFARPEHRCPPIKPTRRCGLQRAAHTTARACILSPHLDVAHKSSLRRRGASRPCTDRQLPPPHPTPPSFLTLKDRLACPDCLASSHLVRPVALPRHPCECVCNCYDECCARAETRNNCLALERSAPYLRTVMVV